MANPAHDMPRQTRSPSEIEFVLRTAKWRRGPEVLRDLARAEAEPEPETRPRAKRDAKARAASAREG